MRNQCHWLALAIASLLVAAVIILSAIGLDAKTAVSAAGTACTNPHDSYCSPQCCGQCHPANLEAWSHTPHAAALVDPAFQVRLNQESDPGSCLVCHTTGYDPEAGRYALAGVTCEACHQPYQQNHSAEKMAIPSPELLCGRCHTDRLEEWQNGLHGDERSCNQCHQVHSG